MSDPDQEIIDSLRRTYEAVNRGDFDAAVEIADSDVELVTTGGFTSLRGTDKLRAWLEPVTLENISMEPEYFEVAGSNVLVCQTSRGRGVASGAEVEMRFWVVWTFNDEGLVARIVAYNHDQEVRARAEAGLPE